MLFIVITMVVIVGVAGLVVTFVAYPHRGQDLPGVPWLGASLGKAVGSLSTISDGELDPEPADGRHRGEEREALL